jgi:diphthine methyl ester synthase
MTLYIIGLGLTTRGISLHGKKILKNVSKIYLESYTVEFPYTKNELEKELKIKVIDVGREVVESERLVNESKDEDVALLVYGSPLSATTHISLINSCKENNVKVSVLHAGSVLSAVAECGLSLYKFGKTASIPKWVPGFKPTSYMDIVKDNQKIGAHTLMLVDIGLSFDDCRKQLDISEKVVVCSKLGVKSRFFYSTLDDIDSDKVKAPYCIIVPGEISDYELESLG